MNNKLSNNEQLRKVTRTLRELLKALPAVRAHCSAEVVARHLQLIAYYQRLYDRLAAPAPA